MPIIAASRHIDFCSHVVGGDGLVPLAFSADITDAGAQSLNLTAVVGDILANNNIQFSADVEDGNRQAPLAFQAFVGEIDNIYNAATNRYEVGVSDLNISNSDMQFSITRDSVVVTFSSINDAVFGELINVNVINEITNQPAGIDPQVEVVAYYHGTVNIADNRDVDDQGDAVLHLAAGRYDIVIKPKLGHASKWRAQAVIGFLVTRGLATVQGSGLYIEEHVVRGFNNLPVGDVLVRAYRTDTDAIVATDYTDASGLWRVRVTGYAPVQYLFTKNGFFFKSVTIGYV